MNNRLVILSYIFLALMGSVFYLHSIYAQAYGFSCNDAFVYIDKMKNERFEGNISITLRDDFSGSAEIVGNLKKDKLLYDVIRSVDFKYRVMSPETLVIYGVYGTVYASDSVNNTFIPDPFLDFLFFRGKELMELTIVINKNNNTYFFGRENKIVFSCTI
ncbi:hypothetical protein [Cedecea sp.]|uniref:hypothetical protein n=1 Tax=Cedecea sp. TaxID=1970739 RepID=UPI0012AE0671|nr:hypothetical protein [Enterobacteriaceae bacterium RIT693]